ncbi:MAG: GNAT family N-acetyltransferase [Ilumatobacter sp.]|nr:GNAT family N-acetyltransferase [Ilumatobacter sp.]
MIDPLVRPADAADAGQLRELEGEARQSLVEQRGGPRWLRTHPERGAAWEASVAAATEQVWVAHIDAVVVGYLVLTRADDVAVVDDVYVTPMARELGFGDALLAGAIEAARRSGARLLEGSSLPGDRDTKNLYERAGIKARLITVSTEL